MNQNTIELAIGALEAERTKIDAAIAELRGGSNGRQVTSKATLAVSAPTKVAGGRRKRRISAAGRAALAAAAKRRWAKAKKAGKKTL
jgi:hypothetical protein